MSGAGSVRGAGGGIGGLVGQAVDLAKQAGHTAAGVVTAGLSGSAQVKAQDTRARMPLGGATPGPGQFAQGAVMATAGAAGQLVLGGVKHGANGARAVANGVIHGAATLASSVSQGIHGAGTAADRKTQASIQRRSDSAGSRVAHGVNRQAASAMRHTMGVFAKVAGTTNPFADRPTTAPANGSPMTNPPLTNPFAASHGVKPPVF